MTRTMQDSDVNSGFLAGADIYAGYVLSDTGQGHNNYVSMCQLPFVIGRKTLSICTRFNATADVLDYEIGTTGTGSANWNKAVTWVVQMRAKGRAGVVYCNASTKPELVTAFANAKVVMTDDDWWIAHWTNSPHMEAGASATQWGGAPGVDFSEVADYWPVVDGPHDPSGGGTPIPAPNPTNEEDDDDMANFAWYVDDGNGHTYVVEAYLAYKDHLATPAADADIKSITVDLPTFPTTGRGFITRTFDPSLLKTIPNRSDQMDSDPNYCPPVGS